MSASGRCEQCGGSNPASAQWCLQCFEPLTREEPPPPPPPPAAPARSLVASPILAGPAVAPDPELVADATPAAPPPPAPGPDSPGGDADDSPLLPLPPSADGDASSTGTDEPTPLASGDGRFRHAADGLEWSCHRCAGWNPLEITTCTACGAPFLRPEDPEPVREVEVPLLVAATLAWPGAGHAMLGRWADAVFRGILALVWGAGGLMLLANALADDASPLPAVPLLLGWLVLAGTSVNDVLVARAGRGRVMLQGRRVLWLVVTVIVLTVATTLTGALGVVGR